MSRQADAGRSGDDFELWNVNRIREIGRPQANMIEWLVVDHCIGEIEIRVALWILDCATHVRRPGECAQRRDVFLHKRQERGDVYVAEGGVGGGGVVGDELRSAVDPNR